MSRLTVWKCLGQMCFFFVCLFFLFALVRVTEAAEGQMSRNDAVEVAC